MNYNNNKNNIWILVIFSLSLLIASVHGSCSATASATARSGGSFQINGVRHQIYDISIRNTGTETISRIFAFFGYPSSASLYQTFNYNGTTGEISNYGGNIFAGQSFNGAGFILAGSGSPTLAFITPTCGSNTPTQGPTVKPTNGPTNGPTNTPTNAPTTPPTAGPTTPPAGTCSSSVSVVRRTASTGSFNENGVPSQIWDLVFTNTGSRSVDGVVISITPAAGTSVNQNNKWNLIYNATTLRYTVSLFGSLSNPGAMYYGSGFAIAGATTGSPVVAVVSTSCPGGNPTNAPTNAPPTNAPTTGPTNAPPTNAPTNAPPTNTPTTAPGSCSSSVSVVRRTASTGTFNENGVPSQIWDLVLTNTGSRSINDVIITITPATGSSVNQNNKWNLVYNSSTLRYSVTLFGALSNPGAMYYGAGFVIAGATTGSPVVAVASTSCN